MVCIDAAKDEGLAGFPDGVFENFGVKKAVVGVVMRDGDAMRVSNAFKGQFDFNSSRSIKVSHEVNVGVIRKMVDKDGGSDITLSGRFTPMDGDETRRRADKLINANNLARCSGWFDMPLILDALVTTR